MGRIGGRGRMGGMGELREFFRPAYPASPAFPARSVPGHLLSPGNEDSLTDAGSSSSGFEAKLRYSQRLYT
jgi:hypothetical protein